MRCGVDFCILFSFFFFSSLFFLAGEDVVYIVSVCSGVSFLFFPGLHTIASYEIIPFPPFLLGITLTLEFMCIYILGLP